MLIGYKRGQGSIILRVKIFDSTASPLAGLTGLTSASSGLRIATMVDVESSTTVYTVAGSTIETISTLGTYAAPTATKCRFKEVDSTNHKGIYEIQIADARFAVSNAKFIMISISGATNAVECDIVIPLRDLDPYDSVRAGLTGLPNANAGASGGLHINGSNSGTTTYAALTVTGSLTISDGLLVSRSSSNSSAIVATGNGTGHGILITSGSGATGNGITIVAASTNGSGIVCNATGTGTGIAGIATDNGIGIYGVGGMGMSLIANTTYGLNIFGSSGSIYCTSDSGTSVMIGDVANGITIASVGNGHGISINGSGSGSGISSTGGATGHGIMAVGGATSGHGFSTSATADGSGIFTAGAGSGAGAGIYVLASANSAGGIYVSATNASAVTFRNVGTGVGFYCFSSSGYGLRVESGNGTGALFTGSGNAAGITLSNGLGTGAGFGFINGDVHGSLTGSVGGSVASVVSSVAATLSAAERNAVAVALLDLIDGIETGVTPRKAIQAMAAIICGDAINCGTSLETYRAIGNPGVSRVLVPADTLGNRTSVTIV